MLDSRELFMKRVSRLNIDLTDKQLDQFDAFYHHLVEVNEYMNLTAITEYEDVLLKHYVDCLAVHVVKEFSGLVCASNTSADAGRVKVIDVGSGAGFPGIPLKIAFPSLEIHLLDALNKRINFLNESIELLQLKGIETFHGRAEDYAKKAEYRASYDLCVSRAVANLSTLSEYCLPFLKVGGLFIALKSGEIQEELAHAQKAIRILGGEIVRVQSFTLPESDIERTFVVISKVQSTPKKYPRKAGLPSKEPLE